MAKIFSNENFTYKPFIISIYSEVSDPKSLVKYSEDFIEELNNLLKNGIAIKRYHFKVKVMCFICDRLARPFIKCIKGHGGYFACERCYIKEISIKGNALISNKW